MVNKIIVSSEQSIRFNELESMLDISPNTLSRRLEELVEVDFLERHSYDEIPPRVEYEPTEELYALRPMFEELGNWLEEHGSVAEFDMPEV